MCICDLTEIFKSWMTPLIAIIAVYIAWQQWQTNEKKFRLDRYDRRYKVYSAVRDILSLIMFGKLTDQNLQEFYRSIPEFHFLFGQEIVSYIDEIYSRGLRLLELQEQYNAHIQKEDSQDYDHKAVCQGMKQEKDWLFHQLVPARDKFKKYLDLNDYGFFSQIKHSGEANGGEANGVRP